MTNERRTVFITKDSVCRTVSGEPVRILCDQVLGPNGRTVVGVIKPTRNSRVEQVLEWTSLGEYMTADRADGEPHPLDLVVDHELTNLIPNEPVLVRNDPADEWKRRHFARVDNGRFMCWSDGRSIYTRRGDNDIIAWKYWKRHDETYPISYFPTDIAVQNTSDAGNTGN